MKYEVLLAQYEALMLENNLLKEENQQLKQQLGIEGKHISVNQESNEIQTLLEIQQSPNQGDVTVSGCITVRPLSPTEKISIFMSLFRGRDDVYAKRWENPKKGTSGYAPVCLNEWQRGICVKPQGKCADCTEKNYAALNEQVIEEHLRGNLVIGIYPMCLNETCYFLAMDFDEKAWAKDITVLMEVCREYDIPVAVERSRSGNGCHLWIFFNDPVPAALARKLGAAMLTCAMNKRHELSFQSYDRLFPSQDTLPKGGFGNLIALPLQKAARQEGNSVFIDENFQAIDDQWGFLATLRRLSEDQITNLINRLCHGDELGALKKVEEENQKPWEQPRHNKLTKNDFPQDIEIVLANMLYIPKAGISQPALNELKRLAAFKNPEFYKSQAMRISTFNKLRIICCADETDEYLCLPRGCEADVKTMFDQAGVITRLIDETNHGINIDVEFNGILRDEQPIALSELLMYDNGVLSGTTAFGKTVVAIKLIAERKVNTLILVDRVSLVSQWRNRLMEFLQIKNNERPIEEKKRGRKRAVAIVGQIGAGKENLTGIIDIAVMQSLNRVGEVNDCIKNYGMIIVDECHHVSAFSFETLGR